jgi:lipoprotein-releasing system ATP-binding protein
MSNQQAQKIELFNVFKHFFQGEEKLQVINNLNTIFTQGETYSITGVSGSGKSTLLHIIGGLEAPSSGHISFNGQNIYSFSRAQKTLFLQNIGFVFQFHYLIKELSVIENIMLPCLVKKESYKKCKARARELLLSMGVQNKANEYTTYLSGGEQQRVSIARALFNKPSFLLADEPTGSLDEDNAQIIINILLNAQKEWGMGIILCSHDPDIYNKMSIVYRLHNHILEPFEKTI